jgi:hypothetical protein
MQLRQILAKGFQRWKDATIACCGPLTCIAQINFMSRCASWKLLLGAAVQQTSWSNPWKGRSAEKASAVRALSLPLPFIPLQANTRHSRELEAVCQFHHNKAGTSYREVVISHVP